jgi:hypothetical protein
MRTAIAASHSSFSFVDESTVGSQTTKLTGDDSHAGADQTVSGSVATLEVVRTTRGNIYLRGAANVLHATLGIPPSTAAANSDHWIVLTPGDTPYSAVASTLEPQKELDSFYPRSPFQLDGPSQFHGRAVLGVKGIAATTAGNTGRHTAIIYVPITPPFSPVGATLTFGSGSGRGLEAVVFGRWGKVVHPPTPNGAVAYSSLKG